MHALPGFAAFTLCLITTSFSDEAKAKPPAKLERIQDNYHAAVSRAVSPLTKAYLSELQKLKTEFTKAGDLESAIAVDNEIKAVMAAGAKVATPPGNQSGGSAESKSKKLPSKADLENLESTFIDKTWQFHGDKGALCLLKKGGKGFSQQQVGKPVSDTVRWHLENDGTLVIDGFGSHKRVKFLSATEAEVIYIAREDGKEYQRKPATLSSISLSEK